MYKFLVLAATLAAANAGYVAGPAFASTAYATPAYAPASYAAPVYAAPAYAPLASTAVGATSQSTLRSLDGNTVVSQYSKAVDTAFSSVRKYDTRVTNDGVALAPAYHAPVVAAAPVVRAAYPAPAAYHSPVVATTPVVKAAYAAPAAYASPAVAHGSLLGVAYSAAPAVAHITFDGYGTHYGY